MKGHPLELDGVFLFEAESFKDFRGNFSATFNRAKFQDVVGYDVDFLQDNQSVSHRNVFRGFHYQVGEFQQAKLIRVVKGTVLDIVLDVRIDSPSFGKHIVIELSQSNRKQLFVPRGFAHGFRALEDDTIFFYKIDNHYSPSSERSIFAGDPALGIPSDVFDDTCILSDKDRLAVHFADAEFI